MDGRFTGMTMLARLTGVAALGALLLTLGAAQDPQIEAYAPGARVTLAIRVEAPAEWALNPQVPLRIGFDEKILEDAGFHPDKPSFDFKVKKGAEAIVAEVPIRVSPNYRAGRLDVPMSVVCSICTLDESSCSFVTDEVRASLMIREGKSGGKAPQKKGTLRLSHVLSMP